MLPAAGTCAALTFSRLSNQHHTDATTSFDSFFTNVQDDTKLINMYESQNTSKMKPQSRNACNYFVKIPRELVLEIHLLANLANEMKPNAL